MKKTFILLLSVVALLAFSIPAFALHAVKGQEYTPGLVKSGKSQIELGGEVRIRGDVKRNVADFNDDSKDTTQKYDQRVRLNIKGSVSANTFGFVELETNDNNSSTYDWGCLAGTSCTEGTNNKRDALYIRQAYIAHQTNALGALSGFKAGHMLLNLGNNIFFDHTNYGDDAIILWTTVGAGELSLITIKLDEGVNAATTQMDDRDAYIAALAMPFGAVNFSADVTYIHNNDKSTYDKGQNLYNVGLRADGDLGAVKVMGDVEFQGGKDKTATTTPTETKYKGYAAQIGAEANAGPAVVRAKFGYGSGDDNATDNDNKMFQTFLTDSQYYTFVYGYSTVGASGAANTGLANTMLVNVGATAKPTADLKVSADLYYLRAAKEVALMGNATKSKKLGTEIDGKLEYQIDSNLAYYIEAGYLVAGDAYDGATTDADNAYRLRHGLLLKF